MIFKNEEDYFLRTKVIFENEDCAEERILIAELSEIECDRLSPRCVIDFTWDWGRINSVSSETVECSCKFILI